MRISAVRSAVLMMAVALGMAAVSQAASYEWVGPANGDWLIPGNWSGDTTFVDDAANVCDINDGGIARITTSNATFSGQLSVNVGGVLNQNSSMGTSTVGSLHLNGGTVNMGDTSTLKTTGGISIDADSTMTMNGWNNNSIASTFTGTANLTIVNNQPSGRQPSMNVGDSSDFNGALTMDGTGFTSIVGDLGTATVYVNSTVNYNCYPNVGTTNWVLDGSKLTFGYQGNVEAGQITVLSDSTIGSSVDYWGKTTTLNGKITGPGVVTLNRLHESRL